MRSIQGRGSADAATLSAAGTLGCVASRVLAIVLLSALLSCDRSLSEACERGCERAGECSATDRSPLSECRVECEGLVRRGDACVEAAVDYLTCAESLSCEDLLSGEAECREEGMRAGNRCEAGIASDVGACCARVPGEGMPAPLGSLPGETTVSSHPGYACDYLTCISESGGAAYCTRPCDRAEECPPGFPCTSVLEAGSDPGLASGTPGYCLGAGHVCGE